MNQPPQPSTYGQIKEFHRKLYEELLDAGYAHLNISKMSVSKALFARYGSAEAADQVLGEGTFKGVQQVYGELVSWRKAWGSVKKEQKVRCLLQRKAMDTLLEAVDQCLEAGIINTEVLNAVQKMLTTSARIAAPLAQPLVTQAQ